MNIPLVNKLKKRLHLEVAMLQDEVVELLYSIDNNLVFHGGTAIWRCYNGNRFSEDLDFYAKSPASLEKGFKQTIESRGLLVSKFKKTENLIFAKVSNGRTDVLVEVNFSTFKPFVSKPFEKADGSSLIIFTLSPESLFLEKIQAYKNRKFIRDIYDIYHLSNLIQENNALIAAAKGFLETLEKPVDEKNLKAIVYSGAIPSFDQMVQALKRRFG